MTLDLHDKDTFDRLWADLEPADQTNDPKAIREAFEVDQAAEDEQEVHHGGV